MSLLLEDILQYFVDNGICKGIGVDAFWDKLPEAPDSCIAVFEYEGMPVEPYEPAVHRSVQVICREPSAILAQTTALRAFRLIQSSLDESGRIDFNGRFTQTSLRQTPFKLDEDESNRVVYGFNMGVTTENDS